MQILRTPDECFDNLAGFPFAPRYTEIDAGDGSMLRIHHVEEGPSEAAPVLLMHGNPTWSYLYRRMIPGLVAAGHRVLAVDLVGCGRSDKPACKADYTLARHVEWMSRWLVARDLRRITLFCQDWGGTIGLHQVANHPERFDRVIASNTGIPLGEGESEFMKMWVGMMREATDFPFAMVAQGMCNPPGEEELRGYLAPFPDPSFQAGILEFPMLIAVQPDNPGVAINREAWAKLGSFTKPFLTLWGSRDPVARGVDKRMQSHIPGAVGHRHHRFEDANHFIQEDVPEALVEHMLRFLGATA